MTISIFNGECITEMKKMKDKSVDLFICDLPYGTTHFKWDTVIDLEEFWKQFRRLRKHDRVACIHFCDTKFGYTLIKSWEKGYKMDLILSKRHKTGGISSQYRPLKNHESLYFFYDKTPKYNRDKYHKRIGAFEYDNPKNKTGGFGYSKTVKHSSLCFEPVQPGSIFNTTFSTRNRFHPTEKGQDILEYLLKYWSDEGDVILDPTMGSGSTGVACKKINRGFVGIELDKKYYDICVSRLEIETETDIDIETTTDFLLQ